MPRKRSNAAGSARTPRDRGAPDAPAEALSDGPDATDSHLMTLEALAELSGVSPRTIRYYQAEKLLQKPARDREDGRVARYGSDHADRLRLIGELRDRGLKLPAIRNLLEEKDSSRRISDWLGLDETLRGSWAQEAARLLSNDELDTALAGTPAGTRGHLEDRRLVVRQGDAWLVPAPALLDLALRLISEGVDVELVLEAGGILQKHLATAAKDLIDLFVAALGQGFGTGTDTATLVHALRPAAGDAARIIFGQQLEQAIDALLADTKRLGRR